MQRNIRQGLAAVVLSASLISINTPATQAMVIPVTTATAIAGSPRQSRLGGVDTAMAGAGTAGEGMAGAAAGVGAAARSPPAWSSAD